MSAEPSVARVQPASPTSLFLMGVAPGRTTVIATTDAGQAIVQYDVTVAPGAGGAGPAAAAVPRAPSPRRCASAIQATIARTVQGASGVRVQGAGTDAILTGTVPNAAAAQQAEAIARGYVGDKGGVIDNLTVLGAIQVNVRVRIAEINRSVTRQLGFNWQALGSSSTWRFGLRTGAAAISPVITPLLPLGLAAALQRAGCQSAWRRSHLGKLGRQRHHRRAGSGSADHRSGGAQPHRPVRRDRELPGGRRVPDPDRRQYHQRRDHDHRRVQDVRRQPGGGADRAVAEPAQPARPARGQPAQPPTARSACRWAAGR